MTMVSSNYAMKRLLEPLGIDTTNLKSCIINFQLDDAVLVTTEHLLDEPTEEAITIVRWFYLAEMSEEQYKEKYETN